MPKQGMEPIRRQALIGAAIEMIHDRGSLDVTVSQIAARAGVSAALAHHYFGGKEDLFLAAMRHLLIELGDAVILALAGAHSPRARLNAIVRANFGIDQFAPACISAWLNFYVKAQESAGAARLLRIYQRRLDANLRHALRPLVGDLAPDLAADIAALIDGLYLRQALGGQTPNAEAAIARIEHFIDLAIQSATA